MARYHDADDYSPFEDDYRGFEIRDDESARGPLILALAIGVLLVFGAVVWNTYRQGVRSNGGGIPSVLADAQPYKRVPEDRGGLKVQDTDKRFYDQMDASERPAEDDVELAELEGAGSQEMLQGGPPIELRPDRVDESALDSDPDNGMPRQVAAQVQALADLEALAPDAEDDIEVSPVRALPATKPVPQPAVRAAPEFAFTSSGSYLVQIAAFRTQDAAEAAWRKASLSHPDLYRGAEKRIQRADLGAKGVFYRLRVGAFAQRTDASEFCAAVKASGGNCIVVSQ